MNVRQSISECGIKFLQKNVGAIVRLAQLFCVTDNFKNGIHSYNFYRQFDTITILLERNMVCCLNSYK